MSRPELFLKSLAVDDDAPDDEYPFDLPAVRHLGRRALTSPVTVFAGENGSGKSTLLEAIAIGMRMNAEGGSRNLRFATRPTHSELHQHLQVARGPRPPRDAWFLRAETFYNAVTAIEEVDGRTALHDMSHGESFLTLALDRFGPRGFYVMDEPEAALSPQRQLAMLARMHQLVQQGTQFVLATHAPILMACPGAEVWWFDDDGVRPIEAEHTDHWQVLRGFLNAPDATLDVLLREDPEP